MTPNAGFYQRKFVSKCFSPYIKDTTVLFTVVGLKFYTFLSFKKGTLTGAFFNYISYINVLHCVTIIKRSDYDEQHNNS